MSNTITTHLGSSTVLNAMHACKPESPRVPQEYRQLSLRVEKKPLSSHDRQKLASGLAEGQGLMHPRMRCVNRRTPYIARNLFIR